MTLDKLITHLREQEVHIFDDGTALKTSGSKGDYNSSIVRGGYIVLCGYTIPRSAW